MATKKNLNEDEVQRLLLQNSDNERETEESEDEYIPQNVSDDSSESSSDESMDTQGMSSASSALDIPARDGTIWQKIDDVAGSTGSKTHAPNIIRLQPGPTAFARRYAISPFAALKLFISQNIMILINKYTCMEGQNRYPNDLCTLNVNELWKFVGLFYARGVLGAKNIPLSELWQKKWANPIFAKTMPRDRFKYILRLLRFDSKQDRRERIVRGRDKFAHISEIWNIFVNNCKAYYNPGANICVDEQLFPTRARCPFTQYIASKPDKFGIKFWVLCDVNSKYFLNAFPYTGEDISRPVDVPVGEHIVWKLSEPFHKQGHNITCDNYFTSLSLAKRLLRVNTTIVGTIRSNRKEIPDEARSFASLKEAPIFSSIFMRDVSSHATLTTYKCKKSKSVHILSSMHSVNIHCDNTIKKKPETVLYYNKTKFGVDILDEMARMYSVKPGCRRWPVHVFCNMLDMAAINAWIIYKESHPTHSNISRRKFLFDLVEEMTDNNTDAEMVEAFGASSSITSRKICQVRKSCKSNRATTTCVRCHKLACGSCTKEKKVQIICKNCV